MSVNALSRLLEALAISVKHAIAMLTILAIELFQARRDAAIASSKLLLDHFNHELRNAPIINNYLTIRSRKLQNLITKRNNIDFWLLPLVIQIHVYNNKNHHNRLQVHSESLDSRQNLIDLNRTNRTGLRINHSPICRIQKRTFIRGVAT